MTYIIIYPLRYEDKIRASIYTYSQKIYQGLRVYNTYITTLFTTPDNNSITSRYNVNIKDKKPRLHTLSSKKQ